MGSALANHLWQSTLFGAAAALLVFALRKNRAQARYWIWLVASLKFLVPFSLIVGLGSLLAPPSAGPIAQPELSAAIEQVSQPFVAPVVSIPAVHSTVNPVPAILLAVWACGFLIVLVRWGLQWRHIRSMVRNAKPASRPACRQDCRPHAGVPILTSRALMEPGVFGVFRPVLLLPEGIVDRLTREQLQAILAHEFCHIRRRDNFFAALHMLVEALFWFHPLVWWIGARLVEERERACDEEVLWLGSEPQVYAESILKTCEFYLESPLVCMSGVTGADLKKRIVRIMTQRAAQKLGRGRKLLLASFGAAAIAGPLAFGLMHIERAYGIRSYQISGPGWIKSARYDLNAEAPGMLTEERLQGMLQTLLRNRFKLALHHEERTFSVYELVVARNGPKLQEGKHGRGGVWNRRGYISAQNASMAEFSDSLSRRMDKMPTPN